MLSLKPCPTHAKATTPPTLGRLQPPQHPQTIRLRHPILSPIRHQAGTCIEIVIR